MRALETDEQFLGWYASHASDFSSLHETAYQTFMQGLNTLLGDGEDFSLEYICNVCLRFGNTVPLERDRTRMDSLQRLLKHFWPNTTAIKQMKDRRIEVSRKALILMYILCDGVTTEPQRYRELDEDYITPRERLEAHAITLDSTLETCGMSTLDPRGPFDWLVMYALCCETDEVMSERMEQVMACVFPPETDSTAR